METIILHHPAAQGVCSQQEAERAKRMDEKLSSLQLDGLVDFSEAAAKFIVLGSTKKHYTVTLSDARHTCQCVDFRCPFLIHSPSNLSHQGCNQSVEPHIQYVSAWGGVHRSLMRNRSTDSA